MDTQNEPATEAYASPTLDMIGRMFEKETDELLQSAKKMILQALLLPGGKHVTGLSADIVAAADERHALTTEQKEAWITEQLSAITGAVSVTAFAEKPPTPNKEFAIDGQGKLSKDLAFSLFNSLGDASGVTLDKSGLAANNVGEFAERWGTINKDSGERLHSAVMVLGNNKEVVGLEHRDGDWYFVAFDIKTTEGWEPYGQGSRFKLPGNEENTQRVGLAESLKAAFSLGDEQLIDFRIRLQMNRIDRHDFLYELGDENRTLKAIPEISPTDKADQAFYGMLLGLPQRTQLNRMFPNAVDIDEAILEELLPETQTLAPQVFSASTSPPNELRDICNRLFVLNSDHERVAFLRNKRVRETQLDDATLSQFSDEHQQALRRVFSKLRIHERFQQARLFIDEFHALSYVEMLEKGNMQDLIAHRDMLGLTQINPRALDIMSKYLRRTGQSLDGISPIPIAFSEIANSTESKEAIRDLYRDILVPDEQIRVDYLKNAKDVLEINENALAEFSHEQQRIIRQSFEAVKDQKADAARSLYDRLCAEDDKDERVKLLKSEQTSRIHLSVLEGGAYSPANRQMILEAFIPVSREADAHEYLYRALLTLGEAERAGRLLKENNVWQIDEYALAKLPLASQDEIRQLFAETQQARDSANRESYERIATIPEESARQQALESDRISRINERALATLPSAQQSVLLTSLEAMLLRKFGRADLSDVPLIQSQQWIDSQNESVSMPPNVTDNVVATKLLGRGTSGAVYLAVGAAKKPIVAKAFKSSGHYARELAISQRLRPHPNVPRFLGALEVDIQGQKNNALGYELVDGVEGYNVIRHLAHSFAIGRESYTNTMAGIQALLFGAYCALENMAAGPGGGAEFYGIAHRDLKIENVMVDKFGVVKLVDWGSGEQMESPPGIDWPSEPQSSLARRIYAADALGLVGIVSRIEEMITVTFRVVLGDHPLAKRMFGPEFSTGFKAAFDIVRDCAFTRWQNFKQTGDFLPRSDDETGSHNSIQGGIGRLVPEIRPGALTSFLRSMSSFSGFDWDEFRFANAAVKNYLYLPLSKLNQQPGPSDWEYFRDRLSDELGAAVLKRAVADIRDKVQLKKPTSAPKPAPPDMAELPEDLQASVEATLAIARQVLANEDGKAWETERAGQLLGELAQFPLPIGKSRSLRTTEVYKLEALPNDPQRLDDFQQASKVGDLLEKASADNALSKAGQIDADCKRIFEEGTPLFALHRLSYLPATKEVETMWQELWEKFPSTITLLRTTREWSYIRENRTSRELDQLKEILKRLAKRPLDSDTVGNPLTGQIDALKTQVDTDDPTNYSIEDLKRRVHSLAIQKHAQDLQIIRERFERDHSAFFSAATKLKNDLNDETKLLESLTPAEKANPSLENIHQFVLVSQERLNRYGQELRLQEIERRASRKRQRTVAFEDLELDDREIAEVRRKAIKHLNDTDNVTNADDLLGKIKPDFFKTGGSLTAHVVGYLGENPREEINEVEAVVLLEEVPRREIRSTTEEQSQSRKRKRPELDRYIHVISMERIKNEIFTGGPMTFTVNAYKRRRVTSEEKQITSAQPEELNPLLTTSADTPAPQTVLIPMKIESRKNGMTTLVRVNNDRKRSQFTPRTSVSVQTSDLDRSIQTSSAQFPEGHVIMSIPRILQRLRPNIVSTSEETKRMKIASRENEVTTFVRVNANNDNPFEPPESVAIPDNQLMRRTGHPPEDFVVNEFVRFKSGPSAAERIRMRITSRQGEMATLVRVDANNSPTAVPEVLIISDNQLARLGIPPNQRVIQTVIPIPRQVLEQGLPVSAAAQVSPARTHASPAEGSRPRSRSGGH